MTLHCLSHSQVLASSECATIRISSLGRAGASSGIGLALAELLAKSEEYVVIATARKPDVIKAKGDGNVLIWAAAASAGVK